MLIGKMECSGKSQTTLCGKYSLFAFN